MVCFFIDIASQSCILETMHRFSFVPSKTSLILTKFLEKYISIYKFNQMHCQDKFHEEFNENNLLF